MSFNMIETAFDWCSTYLAGERIQVLFQDAPGRCSTEDLEASGRGSMTADADISSISTECSGSNVKGGDRLYILTQSAVYTAYSPLIYQVYIAFWSYVILTTFCKNQNNPLRFVV